MDGISAVEGGEGHLPLKKIEVSHSEWDNRGKKGQRCREFKGGVKRGERERGKPTCSAPRQVIAIPSKTTQSQKDGSRQEEECLVNATLGTFA